MATEMTIVKESPEAGRRQRERVSWLERRAEASWFVAQKTPKGGTKWFLRFEVAGFYPRLVGPFTSKRNTILCLNGLHEKMGDFWGEIQDVRDEYGTVGEF